MKLKRLLAAITAVAMTVSVLSAVNVIAEEAASEGTLLFSEDFESFANEAVAMREGQIDSDLLVKEGIGVDGSKGMLLDTNFTSPETHRNTFKINLGDKIVAGKTYKMTYSVAISKEMSMRSAQEWHGICAQFLYPGYICEKENPDKPGEMMEISAEEGKALGLTPKEVNLITTKFDPTFEPDSVRTDLYKIDDLNPTKPFLPEDRSFVEKSIIIKVPEKPAGRESAPYLFEILNICGSPGVSAYIDNIKIEEVAAQVFNPKCSIDIYTAASNVVYGYAEPNTVVMCTIGNNPEKECQVNAAGEWSCYYHDSKPMGYGVKISAYCIQQGVKSPVATASTGTKPISKPTINKIKAKAKYITGKTKYAKAKVEIKYNGKKIGTTKTTAKKTFKFKVPKKIKLAAKKVVKVRVQSGKKWSGYASKKVSKK